MPTILFSFNLFAFIYLLTTLALLAAIFLVNRVKGNNSKSALIYLLIAVLIWNLSAVLEAAALPFELKLLFRKLAFFGVAPVPVLIFKFVLLYTDREEFLKSMLYRTLWFIASVTVFLVFTNGAHQMYWKNVEMHVLPNANVLDITFGPYFFIFTPFTYGLILVSIVLLIGRAINNFKIFGFQMIVLLLPLGVGLLTDMITTLHLEPIKGMDLSPVTFALSGLGLAWGFMMLDAEMNPAPIARAKILDSMQEYLLVFNESMHLINFNRAAEKLFSQNIRNTVFTQSGFIGRRPEELFEGWDDLLVVLNSDVDIEQYEILFERNSQSLTFHFNLTILKDKFEYVIGKLITLNDISAQKEIIASESQARRTAEVLQGIARVIGSTLDREEILELALEEIQKIISYDVASAAMLEGDELSIHLVREYDNPGVPTGILINISDTPNQAVLELGEPILCNDAHNEFPIYQKPEFSKIKSIICAPVIFNERAFGTLTLDSFEKDGFKPEDIPIIKAFASQLAVALENSRLYKQMKENAIRDPLTGVFNRRHFMEVAEVEFDRAQRYGHQLSLILMDLDHFKAVNDTFGHQAGDQALILAVKACLQVLRGSDVFSRFGGEEFAILLPKANAQMGLRAAERMRASIEEICFESLAGKEVRFTASFGISCICPECQSIDDLITEADQAMYKAKESGRNKVSI